MKYLLVFLAISFASLHVNGQDKKEKILQLFRLMQTEKMTNAIVDNMQKVTMSASHQTANPATDSLCSLFVRHEFTSLIDAIMRQEMVNLYDKNFTLAEIEKYLEFYQSPEGKKMIDHGPVIQKELMENTMGRQMPLFIEKLKIKREEIYGK